MWRGERVAVKKLPTVWQQQQHCAPPPKAQYLALVDEIRLTCRFKCNRLVRLRESVLFRILVIALLAGAAATALAMNHA